MAFASVLTSINPCFCKDLHEVVVPGVRGPCSCPQGSKGDSNMLGAQVGEGLALMRPVPLGPKVELSSYVPSGGPMRNSQRQRQSWNLKAQRLRLAVCQPACRQSRFVFLPCRGCSVSRGHLLTVPSPLGLQGPCPPLLNPRAVNSESPLWMVSITRSLCAMSPTP